MSSPRKKHFIILDRDGTVIVEKNYLSDPDAVELLPGVVTGLRRLAESGYKFVIITNQSGVGRGYFPLTAVDGVNQRIASLLQIEGIRAEGFYVCPHAPHEECKCRKPETGMLFQAAAEHGFDPINCWVIGDKIVDIELGKNAGTRTILVRTGYGAEVESTIKNRPDAVANNLDEASEIILRSLHPYRKNLAKTMALIDACFALKKAYLKSKHPDVSIEELRRMLFEGVVERKERQWSSVLSSSHP